jgi:hypothetical protein
MRYSEFKLTEQQLDELKMSPTSLRTMAATVDARAGMEFEMVVPGEIPEDADFEPDYDQDTRANSIDDIIEFFSSEDEATGQVNGRQELAELRQALETAYFDWADEETTREWRDVAQDEIAEFLMDDEEWFEEALRQYLLTDETGQVDMFGGDKEESVEKVIAAWRDAPRFMTSKEQQAYTQENPAYEVYLRSEKGVAELADAQAELSIEEQDGIYDSTFEQWRERQGMPSEEDWLGDTGLRYMSEIENSYGQTGITWPHYTTSASGDGADIYTIAGDFRQAIGRDVEVSESYHGARRLPNAYAIEPDGSIYADSGYAGIEFISPPLPVTEMLDDLKKVKEWAGLYGCETNQSTGLHMNVSVPGYSLEKLDYIKLALFIGDQYILNQFGRASNTYCKSAISKIESRIRPEDVAVVMQRMREHLNAAASKIIHTGITDKYTSINTKDGYVEFRSPGGDWLSTDFDKLENTLLRFVVGLSIAVDENAFKEEYAKKLYKLIAPSDNPMTNTLQYFARYSAGELPASALKSYVKHAQTIRQSEKAKPQQPPATATQNAWWRVISPGGFHAEVQGTDQVSALARARQLHPTEFSLGASSVIKL